MPSDQERPADILLGEALPAEPSQASAKRGFDDDQTLLAGVLAEAIASAGDGEVLELHDLAVELSTLARGGDERAPDELAGLIGELDAARAELLVRSLTRWFQLANLAEDNERIRRLHAAELRDAPKPRRGSVLDAVGRLNDEGTTAADLSACSPRPRCDW